MTNAVIVSSQDLKSRPQGNGVVSLNGTFEIPRSVNDSAAQRSALTAVLADLDYDGINELVTGHADSVVIQRGDMNAFAPKTNAAYEAIRDLRFISPFESKTRVISVPFPAEMIATGDFTRDGKPDIVVGSRGADRIVLLEAGRNGGFKTREIFVGGLVTALASGDINRPDGLTDVILGVGAELVTFEGRGDIFTIAPRRIFLPHGIETVATGQLDSSDFVDIAAASGNLLTIVSGGDESNEVSTLVRAYSIKSILVGEFVPDRAYRPEIAILDDNGKVHVMTRGDLDTRPVTYDEQLFNQVREMDAKGWPVPARVRQRLNASGFRELERFAGSDEKTWADYDSFDAVGANVSGSPDTIFSSGRLSNYGEDLIVVNQSTGEVVVMPLVFNPETSEAVSYRGFREQVKFQVGGSPVAAIAGRLNFDGDRDLLVINGANSAASALLTAPQASFTVNSNGDAVDANPGNGVCATAGAVCTLRAAIMEANHLAGNDSITINAGLNITLSTGRADNDAIGDNSEAGGDLDIFCAINATEDSCILPLNTNNNDVSIIGNGNTITAGTFSGSLGNGITTDRVFDIGMDGVFGGGFGAGTGLDITMSNITLVGGNVREDRNDGVGAGNFARGGAIRMDGFGQGGTRGSLSLTSVTINGNQADHDTGGVFNQYSSVTFSTVTATGNIGKAGPGGALQFLASSPATLSVSGSTFSTNESRLGNVFGTPATDTDGGAVAANGDTNTLQISSTNFTSNISQDDGGAVKAFNGAFTITGGTMSGNTARDDGGAIWGDIDTVGAGRFLTLSSVTINGNTANSDSSGGGDGGGVFRDRGTLNVTNCFIGTVVSPNAAVNGGGIAHAFRTATNPSNVTTINIDNGSVVGNNANTTGGGVFFNSTNNAAGDPSDLNIGNTTSLLISENNANLHGGGVAILGAANANLTRAFMHGNDADKDNNASGDGGAVYTLSGNVTIPSTSAIGTATGNTAENGGAIHHVAGTLNLNGAGVSNNSGDIHGGGLSVAGGTVNVTGMTFASNTSGSGTEIRLTGGTTNFFGTNTIPGEISIAGGTLNAGSSTINLGEDFHFSSGTFTGGTSTFDFNGTGAQQIYGGSTPTFFNLTDSNTAQPLIFNNSANANGTLTVNASATLSPVSAALIGGSGTLTGSGTVRVNRATGTNDFLGQYTITNKTLTNLLVDFVGGSTQGVSATTYGAVRINNSNGANLSGNATIGGAFTIQNGTVNVLTNTLTLNSTVTASGGGILGSSPTGTVIYNQASNGQTVLPGTFGNITFSNFNKTLPSGTLNIAGTFIPGTAIGHTTTGNTINYNGAGAQTIAGFTYNNLSTSGGGVKTTGLTVNVGGNMTVNSPTTLSVASGSILSVAGTLTNNSIIQGNGTIVNSFTNTATIAPGLSPGILSVTGNLIQSGTFNVEIGGTGGAGVNPNGHDQLLVSGAITLGGHLNVTLTNGFTPAAGNTFVIIDAGSSTGSFSTATVPDISPNAWQLTRDEAAGIITLVVLPPTTAAASISGRILTSGGSTVRGATVTATSSTGATVTARTNTFGRYNFPSLAAGETYTITAFAKGIGFQPRVVVLSDSVSDIDLIGENERR